MNKSPPLGSSALAHFHNGRKCYVTFGLRTSHKRLGDATPHASCVRLQTLHALSRRSVTNLWNINWVLVNFPIFMILHCAFESPNHFKRLLQVMRNRMRGHSHIFGVFKCYDPGTREKFCLQAILKIIVQWWPHFMILAREMENVAILPQFYDENIIF